MLTVLSTYLPIYISKLGNNHITDYFSFNYGTTNTATATAQATTHLQNQDYTICLRREAGYCLVCYSEWATSTAALGSFGLSISNIAMSEAASVGLTCVTDYLDVSQL